MKPFPHNPTANNCILPPPPKDETSITEEQWKTGFPFPLTSTPTPQLPSSPGTANVCSLLAPIAHPFAEHSTSATAQPTIPQSFQPQALVAHYNGFAGNAGFDTGEECEREFPVECLPSAIRQIAEEVSRSTLAPVSLSAACVLGTVSAALGAGLEVATGGGESLRGNLFILAGAESGTGKSRTFKAIVAPLKEFEHDLVSTWRENTKHNLAAELAILEGDLSAREKSAKSGKNPLEHDPHTQEVARLMKAIESVKRKLIEPRMIVSDATKEALCLKLAQGKNEAIASMSSEGRGCIDVLCGRYNKMTDESIYLAGYSGDSMTIDRINREQVLLKRPCLLLLWLSQLDKIYQLIGTTAFTESGLIPRCLIFNSGARPQDEPVNRHAVNDVVKTNWRNLVYKLAQTFHQRDLAIMIQPSPQVVELFRQYHNQIAQRRRSGDLTDVNSYAARWTENAWKIALVLHAGFHGDLADNHELSAETAASAITVMNWFADQQLEILSGAREQKKNQRFIELLQLLDGKAGFACTLRDLARRHNYERSEIEAIVKDHPDQLEIIKIQPSIGGRPSEIVRLIPSGSQ